MSGLVPGISAGICQFAGAGARNGDRAPSWRRPDAAAPQPGTPIELGAVKASSGRWRLGPDVSLSSCMEHTSQPVYGPIRPSMEASLERDIKTSAWQV